MKRPEELAEKEIKSQEENKKIRIEERQRRIQNNLETIMDVNTKNGMITSKGGKVIYSDFNKEDLELVKEYFKEHGWDCTYSPYEEDGWSMTTESSYSVTTHRFYIKPLMKKW